VEQISQGAEMRTRDKKRIVRDFYRGMSVASLARKYARLFGVFGTWEQYEAAIEKILREDAKDVDTTTPIN
jgi:hypothetical protein